MYAEPIFSEEGGFPKDFAERVAKKSMEQGYKKSRMPEFTDEEKEYVRGAYDFFGVNHYSGFFVSATEYKTVNPIPSFLDDEENGIFRPAEWPASASPWLVVSLKFDFYTKQMSFFFVVRLISNTISIF